jgi:hypothetical protein
MSSAGVVRPAIAVPGGGEQIVQTATNNAENRAMPRGLHAWFGMSRPEAVAVFIGCG